MTYQEHSLSQLEQHLKGQQLPGQGATLHPGLFVPDGSLPDDVTPYRFLSGPEQFQLGRLRLNGRFSPAEPYARRGLCAHRIRVADRGLCMETADPGFLGR